MGIIPAVVFDVVAAYAADVFTAPLPVAVATVLAVVTVVGLRTLGTRLSGTARPTDGRRGAPHRRPRERSSRPAVALLPRLPRRMPQTRTPRPAPLPAVAASRPLRGPPGSSFPSSQRRAGGAVLPC